MIFFKSTSKVKSRLFLKKKFFFTLRRPLRAALFEKRFSKKPVDFSLNMIKKNVTSLSFEKFTFFSGQKCSGELIFQVSRSILLKKSDFWPFLKCQKITFCTFKIVKKMLKK
jgi:hypothetical protein